MENYWDFYSDKFILSILVGSICYTNNAATLDKCGQGYC